MTEFSSQPIPPDPALLEKPPARRESVRGIVLSWIVIIGMVIFIGFIVPRIGLREKAHAKTEPTTRPKVTEVTEAPGDDLALRIMGRYAVGWKALGSGVSSDLNVGKMIVPQVLETAKTPIDRIKAAVVIAELEGPDRAIKLIKENEPKVAASAREDAQVLLRLYRDDEKLDAADRERLAKDLGWFGELAAGYKQADSDPMRQQALSLAKRTSLVLLAALGAVGFSLFAGTVLLIIAIILYFNGRLRPRYAPPSGIAGPYVEAFALYLILFMLGSIGLALLTHGELGWSMLLTVLMPLAWLWPRWRGAPRDEIWTAIGWHRGRGVFTEIACGVLGYITGLPIIALGMVLVWIFILISKNTPSHPIQNELSTAPLRAIELYLIAAVWAPIFEETMFRGALFAFLRSRFRWLFSASVVALIFAMIHPQGWTTWPALFAIAMVLAGIREWRGSIIGSMTAHALHNGTLVTILIFAVA